MSIRLNKLLAQRGIGARRKCDELIKEGAVQVNGRVVVEPGTQIEPERDRVTVRGRSLPPPAAPRYFVLNKPVGVISTLSDPEGRRTVAQFLPPGTRVFPVGRLDADTSGLLILTNDGELAHHLMHPRYGVEKVYRARLDRAPGPGALESLRNGFEFEPGIVSAPCRVRVLQGGSDHAVIEVTIHEGRYRQVRRMFEALGSRVVSLHRSAYGPLRMGQIERGMWRELSTEEVRRLRESAARPQTQKKRGQRGHGARLTPRERAGPAGAPSEARTSHAVSPSGAKRREPAPSARGGAPPQRGAHRPPSFPRGEGAPGFRHEPLAPERGQSRPARGHDSEHAPATKESRSQGAPVRSKPGASRAVDRPGTHVSRGERGRGPREAGERKARPGSKGARPGGTRTPRFGERRPGGGRPFTNERGPKRDRPSTSKRGAKDARPFPSERGSKGARPSTSERGSKGDRPFTSERGAKVARSFTSERGAKGERPSTSKRGAKDARPFPSDRGSKGERSFTSERGAKGERPFPSKRRSKRDLTFFGDHRSGGKRRPPDDRGSARERAPRGERRPAREGHPSGDRPPIAERRFGDKRVGPRPPPGRSVGAAPLGKNPRRPAGPRTPRRGKTGAKRRPSP